jgi:hypothetical protein
MISFLIRIGLPAAVVAAVIGIAGDAYHFTLDDRSEVASSLGYRMHGIALMVAFLLVVLALLRIMLLHDQRWGVVGRVGFVLALAGTITTIADIWAETIVLPGVARTAPELLEKEARSPGAPTRFLGGGFDERRGTWLTASALTHAGPASAPTLFINSTVKTPILPGRQAMSAKLLGAGVESSVITVTDTPHPFWLLQPWFEPTLRETARFLGGGRPGSPAIDGSRFPEGSGSRSATSTSTRRG